MQYSLVEINFDGLGDVEPTALIGILGHFMTDNVAFEGRFGIRLQDDDLLGVDVKIDRLIGIYGVFHASSSNSTFYGVFGYSDAEAEFSGPGGSAEGDNRAFHSDSASTSAGSISNTRLHHEDGAAVTAISIVYLSRF